MRTRQRPVIRSGLPLSQRAATVFHGCSRYSNLHPAGSPAPLRRTRRLSPSALTRTVQRIKEELGVRAFLRDNRRVTLLAMGSLGYGVGVATRLVWDKSTLQDQLRVLDVRSQLAPFIIGACTFRKNRDNQLVAAYWATVGQQTAPAAR